MCTMMVTVWNSSAQLHRTTFLTEHLLIVLPFHFRVLKELIFFVNTNKFYVKYGGLVEQQNRACVSKCEDLFDPMKLLT